LTPAWRETGLVRFALAINGGKSNTQVITTVAVHSCAWTHASRARQCLPDATDRR
jgi:hypothetical protein